MRIVRFAAVATLMLGSVAATVLPAAPAAAAVNTAEPGPFVDTLADEAFATLRAAGGNRAAARTKFRSLLAQHFAVDAIGDRLISRWRPTITPAQYDAYRAALPSFLIGAYADRLYDYSDADLKVVRAVQQGANAAVQTTVVKPGAQPINAVWTVTKTGGAYKVSNLTVGGINLSLTQKADFDSFVQRRGFDALVAFMKSKG
jgi:phospholipid transport system substrate-binding protein